MKLIKHIFVLVLLIMFSACENDNNIPLNENALDGEANPFLQNFGDAIQARFIGTVVNEQNNPISGVTISIGTTDSTTDANGVFSIVNATVFQEFAHVKATKSGFIDGSRSLVPTSGVNQVKIMLLSLDPLATITSGQAFTIDFPDGTEVDLPANYINQFGGPYQGNVDVIIKTLNIDDENMQLQMPGNLTAQNIDGDLRVLESYGMIAVELRGEGGEELNIDPETPATIRIPVGSSAINPPATIPLWSFDKENGFWVEEGFATLEGNRYVGEVSHFSFWNCDVPFETVNFCVTIVDVNNNPIPNTIVQLEREVSGWTSITSGYTDNDGLVCGLVPVNEALTLIIPDFGCTNNEFSMTLGPYSEDQNISVTVQNSNALTTGFTATFNDCDGDAITNGYLQLFYDNESQIIPITNGEISLVIDYCSANTSFSAQVIDINNSQSSVVINGNFTSPTTALGTEMSCTDLTDTDSDGVIDIDEDINGNNNLDDDDTDGDNTPDYLDEDDDGDGVNTADEDLDNDGNPTNDDTDGDGIPNYLDNDNDNDGLTDIEELTGIDNLQNNCNPNGNITDPNDADSDDDGFNDCVEANAGTDPNDVTSTPVFNCCDNNTLSGMDVNTIADPQDDVLFYDIITPNGDGFNDGFQIDNISLYPNNVLSIYNDQDVLVYETTDYGSNNNFFVGFNSSTNLALLDGTYRYQLTFDAPDGVQNIRNGFVCVVTQFYPTGTFSGACNLSSGFDPIIAF